ncbi:NAD-dependent glycerol-3-phosphate dehydrogenase [Scenedesmus sp. NREL 46B-D3]|nr:NAD-dependent glycerol-3-phosphate dehydrogenase [Scenedesmus sp. NREL 46B-D3]
MSGLSTERTNVGVVGGGAWGTALAVHCASMGHQVLLWALEPEVVAGINGPARENTLYLPGHKCPEGLSASSSLQEVASSCNLLLIVVPTPFIEKTLAPVAAAFKPDCILVSCTKGILNDTLETPHEILLRVLPRTVHSQLAYLSGPSFASEVVQGLPTVVTIAAQEERVAGRVQALLSTPRFRCYRTTDVIGVELGGALKNVLAIACGISDGLNLGNNARAALITRGLAEITRLAVAKGANPLTMGGLAGMGDLVLTCTGDLSRNRTVGLRLGRGELLGAITASMHGAVAEGVLTSRSAYSLSRRLGVEVPIIEGIWRVIHEGEDALTVVQTVMSRELKPELDMSMLAAMAPSMAFV